jgi:hypothetical protein
LEIVGRGLIDRNFNVIILVFEDFLLGFGSLLKNFIIVCGFLNFIFRTDKINTDNSRLIPDFENWIDILILSKMVSTVALLRVLIVLLKFR